MSSIRRSALSVTLIVLLSFSFLQVMPIVSAQRAAPDALPSKPFPGFTAKGPAPDGMLVTVNLAIPLRNLGLLSSAVKQVSDPASPFFRHFFTQQQLAEEFYPTAEYDSLMQYLSTTGLTVQFTALDSFVAVQGTAAQVKQAFGTDIKLYTNGTASYYASSASSFRGAFLLASNATAVALRPAALAPTSQNANVTFTESSFSAKMLQSVYNATSLYARGFNGTGKTIGLLDFYGSPTIASDLKSFDKRFGFPDPTFNIIPIGPYAPNLGAYTGWSTEISLDVEVSHAMAPGATVDLYIGNGAESIAAAIAKVVSDGKVNTLSQSFTDPEWFFNYFGPAVYEFNALLPDQYYMMGALKGITFMGSTGDGGGSGTSNGPEGNLGYPASSPYVTAVGGTQTYFAGSSFTQTGWSNIGFVPNFVNEGGSSGGVSVLEPLPWYQASQSVPPTYPAGRMNPDLSLQGGVDPATYIVDSGSVIGEGGTSESSPLFSGLVALLDSSINGNVGLINPFIYSIANNPATYSKAFTPITFGYTVPWVAGKGYNLVTGWGSPNIGAISSLYKSTQSQPSLNVTVSLSAGVDTSHLEFTPGSHLNVTATVKNGATLVTSGSFTATLVTLTSSTDIPISYDNSAGAWKGTLTMASQSGPAYVNVQGSGGGLTGEGFATLFAGYLGTFISPVPTDPWSTVGGLPVTVVSTTLDGASAPAASLSMEIDSYSIGTNTYSQSASVKLPVVSNAITGIQNEVILNQSLPDGASTMVLKGSTYGYLPFISGLYLQTTFIYPAVAAEPGSVAPGQELTIIADPVAPFNLYFFTSSETGSIYGNDVAVGSNVTAQLVNPSGTVVSSASLAYQSCKEALRVCNGGASVLNGYLSVPAGSASGLYTIRLSASYGSVTIGKTINGSYYSQVWVSSSTLTPSVTIAPGFISAGASGSAAIASLYEGEQAHVVAKIAYPNGTAVKYGEFSVLVYPQELQDQYTKLMHTEYANSELVQLTYDPAMQAWLGNVTLPAPANAGSLAPVVGNSLFYSGPYDAYVTGLSSDGYTTTTALAAQQPFFVQPYVFVNGGTVSSLTQSSQLAFSGATITASGTMSGDLFVGTNTVSGGTLTITGSQIAGNLVVNNANLTLVGVSGGDVTATNSQLTLKDSSVGSLSLTGTKVTLGDSSYRQLSPAPATFALSGLSQPISGSANFTVTVTGQQLSTSSLAAWVDGSAVTLSVAPSAKGLTAVGSINASSLNDGVHSLTVTATQADGLSSSFSSSFSTNAQATSLGAQLTALGSQLQQADANISSLTSQLKQTNSMVGTLFDYAYVIAAVAVIAVALGVLRLRRK